MSTFMIDRANGAIIVNGSSIPFDKFLNDKSQVGRSAYEEWLLLPGNAGKSVYEFIAFLKGTNGSDGTDAYNITIDTDSNYLIPTGKHVILNAPIVDIIQNFECDLGGTFEIINEGCKSNCP